MNHQAAERLAACEASYRRAQQSGDPARYQAARLALERALDDAQLQLDVEALVSISHLPHRPRPVRRLKDLYPCRHCKKPVPVRSRREIEFAACEPCRERVNQMEWGINRAHRAMELYEKNRRSHTSATAAGPGILEACSEALRAAKALIRAAELQPDPFERTELTKVAATWSRWAAGLAKSMTSGLESQVAKMPARPRNIPRVVSSTEPAEVTAPRMGHLSLLKTEPEGGANG